MEDACWLRPTNDALRIKLAKLDVAIKGLNLAFQWQAKFWRIKTDSLCKARLRINATSEMLVRRRLSTVKELVEQYKSVDVMLVVSNQKLADKLTRAPQRWLDMAKKGAEPMILPSII